MHSFDDVLFGEDEPLGRCVLLGMCSLDDASFGGFCVPRMMRLLEDVSQGVVRMERKTGLKDG
jgi:hypothetical protein